jgi:hypothetical protein
MFLSQGEWQEVAGSLLLLAAVQQTEALTQLEAALTPKVLTAAPSLRLARLQPAPLRRQLLTLLFLEAVGLRRTWDLRGYSGQALALLTNRRLAYGYRHIERFLAELARVGADKVLTQALAGWTASLWKRQPTLENHLVPVYYIDGHRKAVYSDSLIPRGLVGRMEKVLGCRALVVLHDQEGHPLLVTTHRGDHQRAHGSFLAFLLISLPQSHKSCLNVLRNQGFPILGKEVKKKSFPCRIRKNQDLRGKP